MIFEVEGDRISQRILVVGTSFGGGNWPPLAAVTVALFEAGHEVQCFGDRLIAHDFASAARPINVVQAQATLGTFTAQWVAAGGTGPSRFRVVAAVAPAMTLDAVQITGYSSGASYRTMLLASAGSDPERLCCLWRSRRCIREYA